jgi:hypothetical protein
METFREYVQKVYGEDIAFISCLSDKQSIWDHQQSKIDDLEFKRKYLNDVIGEYQDQVKSLEQKLEVAVEALRLIYKAEKTDINISCYECSTILSNIAQDALGIPYGEGDFSIADRYFHEAVGEGDTKTHSISKHNIWENILNTYLNNLILKQKLAVAGEVLTNISIHNTLDGAKYNNYYDAYNGLVKFAHEALTKIKE